MIHAPDTAARRCLPCLLVVAFTLAGCGGGGGLSPYAYVASTDPARLTSANYQVAAAELARAWLPADLATLLASLSFNARMGLTEQYYLIPGDLNSGFPVGTVEGTLPTAAGSCHFTVVGTGGGFVTADWGSGDYWATYVCTFDFADFAAEAGSPAPPSPAGASRLLAGPPLAGTGVAAALAPATRFDGRVVVTNYYHEVWSSAAWRMQNDYRYAFSSFQVRQWPLSAAPAPISALPLGPAIIYDAGLEGTCSDHYAWGRGYVPDETYHEEKSFEFACDVTDLDASRALRNETVWQQAKDCAYAARDTTVPTCSTAGRIYSSELGGFVTLLEEFDPLSVSPISHHVTVTGAGGSTVRFTNLRDTYPLPSCAADLDADADGTFELNATVYPYPGVRNGGVCFTPYLP